MTGGIQGEEPRSWGVAFLGVAFLVEASWVAAFLEGVPCLVAPYQGAPFLAVPCLGEEVHPSQEAGVHSCGQTGVSHRAEVLDVLAFLEEGPSSLVVRACPVDLVVLEIVAVLLVLDPSENPDREADLQILREKL